MTDLNGYGTVPLGVYQHRDKVVAHRDDLVLEGTYLKWYDLIPQSARIEPTQDGAAREFLRNSFSPAASDRELGFVINHRAGDVLILIASTWRVNELWETIYIADVADEPRFRTYEFPDIHRGTYCVWELGIVAHERDAWRRYLMSERTAADKGNYIVDRFSGKV